MVSGYDDYRDRYYSAGGALKLGNRLEWMSENLRAPGYHQDFSQFVLHLPVRSADLAALGWTSPMYREVMEHPAFDSLLARHQHQRASRQSARPGIFGGRLVRQFRAERPGSVRRAAPAKRREPRPGGSVGAQHVARRSSSVSFGTDSTVPVRALQMEWFDQWLMGKDSPLLSKPPVKIFVMGSNLWREVLEWPPPDARQKILYLESAGKANSLAGDGALSDKPARKPAADQFVFDPYSPVPTRGGAVCCNPRVFPWGPLDQRPVELRKDVLVYTTKPLKHDLEAIGSVQAVLYVASSARDTDFTAKLVDVFPDGEARNLTDGILRLRYRNSLEKPELATPGEIYRVTMDAGVTGNVF